MQAPQKTRNDVFVVRLPRAMAMAVSMQNHPPKQEQNGRKTENQRTPYEND